MDNEDIFGTAPYFTQVKAKVHPMATVVSGPALTSPPLWFLFLSLLHHSPYLGHVGRSVLLGHAGQPSPRSAWHSPTPGNHVTCLGHAPCSPAHRPYHPGTYDFLTHSLLFLFRLLAVSPRTGVSVLRAGTFVLLSLKINKGNLS